MSDRLQKVLSRWGVASRRGAEQLIRDGRVRLNGTLAQLGQTVDPDVDRIEVDGQVLGEMPRPRLVYLLMNKPRGVVTTCDDPQGRTTILDLLPPAMGQHQGIHPVGRLDVDTSGALLLTNDGDFTFRLTHPRHAIAKTYNVWVRGIPSERVLSQWRRGVRVLGRTTLPAKVTVRATRADATLLEVVLREGRNRQIRRIAEQLNHPVIRLHRVAIGNLRLGSLKSGQYRSLTSTDLQSLE